MSGTPLFSEVNITSRPSKLTTVSARLMKKNETTLSKTKCVEILSIQ